MTRILNTIIFFSSIYLLSAQNIKTTVFTLNLGEPNSRSLINSDSNTKLVFNTKSTLAFKLINGNPYKYKYVINHKLVNFFEDQSPNVFDSLMKALNVNAAHTERGPASIDSSAYVAKSNIAQQILNDSSNVLFSEKMTFNTPDNADEDFENIINAAKILDTKAQKEKADVDFFMKQIASEDYLNKTQFEKQRKKYFNAYNKLLSDISKLNKAALELKKSSATYENTLETFYKTAASLNEIVNKMFTVKLDNYLVPLDINGKNIDLVEVTVERYSIFKKDPTPDSYKYAIWVKGGVKIDVSAGLFITSLTDKNFYTKDTTVKVNGADKTHKQIFEKDNGVYDYGFGSTVNIALRGASWIRPALSIGALFKTNQKFQIITGLGLIIGKEERVILHWGLTMGTATTLTKTFTSDDLSAYDLGVNGVVPTNEKFNFGHFFGITYNLGKNKTPSNSND
jgi:hypothetical protein